MLFLIYPCSAICVTYLSQFLVQQYEKKHHFSQSKTHHWLLIISAIIYGQLYLLSHNNWFDYLLLGLPAVFYSLILIDYRHYLLPNGFIFLLIIIGLLVAYLQCAINTFPEALWGLLFGYLILFVPARIYYLVRQQIGLGGGDIKLMAALGCWLPTNTLPHLLLIACLSAIGYQYLHPKKMIAFGPHLISAAWILLIIYKK